MDIKIGKSVAIACYTGSGIGNDADDRKRISSIVKLMDGNVIAYASQSKESTR